MLPEDDYEAAARELNAKATQLQSKLGSTLVTRALLFVSAFGILLPWLLALPRIQYEPPPPNETAAITSTDWSDELNGRTENSTNVTCVNCVPENSISVIIEYEPMELEDWIYLASFGGAFVVAQIAVYIWCDLATLRLATCCLRLAPCSVFLATCYLAAFFN